MAGRSIVNNWGVVLIVLLIVYWYVSFASIEAVDMVDESGMYLNTISIDIAHRESLRHRGAFDFYSPNSLIAHS